MRLLLTIPEMTLDYGGPSLSALRTAEGLAALGAQVAIAHGAHADARRSAHPGVRMLPIEDDGWRGYARRLREAAQEMRAEAIYDFGVWQPRNAASALAARALDLPWLISPRGMLEPWSLSSKRLKKKIAWTLYQRRLLRAAAALIATSTEERDNLQRLLPGVPVRLAPNGVDLPDVPESAAPRPAQALYLSRLDPKKQPDLLIKAWDALRPEGWRLVIAGPGDAGYRARLREMIDARGLQDVVELREGVFGAEKDKLMLGSRLFVLPTFSENFGIAVAEALAYGLPVITTTGTPWGELPGAGCGWIVPPDEAGVTQALKEALALPAQELARMGQRGREHARLYSWERTARCVHEACSEALGRSAA